MTSIGTGYDLAASTYSPDGRLFQVEYAQKAIDAAGTFLGLKCTDGIVLAVEKPKPTRLLKPAANHLIHRIHSSAACVGGGVPGDYRHLMLKCREEAEEFRGSLGEVPEVKYLADRMGLYVQQHTLYSSVRPFGASAVIGGCDDKNAGSLFMVEPTGRVHAYQAVALGRARQHARTLLEKLISNGLPTTADGVKEAVKILVAARQEDPSAREKQVELEVAVIQADHFRHVPLEELNQLAAHALDELSGMDFVEL